MSSPEVNQHIPRSSRTRELVNFAREQITKYQAGEISRLPKWGEVREQFGYQSNTPFYKTLRRAGVLEEWREAKKIKKKKSHIYYDNSGIEQNIPPILRDTHGRVVWGLPDNTAGENEQIGIHNIQALFLKTFPDFNESYPRGEDGKIAEDKRDEAKEFIVNRIKSLEEFLKIFTSSTVDQRRTPYFGGSHIIATQKSFFSWGLTFERKEFLKHRGIETSLSNEAFVPSHELAWIIGVLAGGGYSNPNDKRISMDSDNEEFVSSFKSTGERLFGVNASVRTKKVENNARKLKGIVFHSKEVAKAIGDLRATEWPNTIIGQHKWIIENSNYLWSFIEGVFERRGNVFVSNNRAKAVFIGTDYANVANFIMELLVRLGVENPVIEHNRRGREGVKGVRVYGRQDLKHFAENIHSIIPEKENRLSPCRELKRYNRNRSTSSVTATQEIQIFP